MNEGPELNISCVYSHVGMCVSGVADHMSLCALHVKPAA